MEARQKNNFIIVFCVCVCFRIPFYTEVLVEDTYLSRLQNDGGGGVECGNRSSNDGAGFFYGAIIVTVMVVVMETVVVEEVGL